MLKPMSECTGSAYHVPVGMLCWVCSIALNLVPPLSRRSSSENVRAPRRDTGSAGGAKALAGAARRAVCDVGEDHDLAAERADEVRLGQRRERVVTALDEHVRPERADELARGVCVERDDVVDARERGQQ